MKVLILTIFILTALILVYCTPAPAEECKTKVIVIPLAKQATGDTGSNQDDELIENVRQATRWLLNHAKTTTARPDELADIDYHLDRLSLPDDCDIPPCPTGD